MGGALNRAPNVFTPDKNQRFGPISPSPVAIQPKIRPAEEVRLHRRQLYQEGLATWLRFNRESLEEAVRAREIRSMDPEEISSLRFVRNGLGERERP